MTQNVTGSSTEVDAKRSGKIIPFPQHSIADTSFDSTNVLNAEYVPSDRTKGQYPIVRTKNDAFGQTFVAVKPVSREFLDNAFEKITDAIDGNLSQAERSNCFDEWADLLKNIAGKIEHFSSNHRKVLGALISSTAKKDISDFTVKSLKIFIQNTNILRQPRITKPEARQAIRCLLVENIDPLIPLAVDESDERNLDELDNLIAGLLAEDKKVNDQV